jgi:tetratricopeptide (TPR) repeat protein
MTRRTFLSAVACVTPLLHSPREVVQQATLQYTHFTPQGNAAAARLCREALVWEPTSVRATALLAATHRQDWTYAWSQDPARSAHEALRLSARAVALARHEPPPQPFLPYALMQRGYALLGASRHQEALAVLDEAVTHTPTYADGYAASAYVLTYAGEPTRALEAMATAERYARQPFPAYYDHHVGQAAYVGGDFSQAERRLREALRKEPAFRSPRTYLVATLWEQGQTHLAAHETAVLRTLGRPRIAADPGAFRVYVTRTHPFTDAHMLERLLASWTAAEHLLETVG